jgi:hypothetical protein
MGRSLIQRSPTESCVPVFNPETSTMRRPRPEWGCWTQEKVIGLPKKETEIDVERTVRDLF